MQWERAMGLLIWELLFLILSREVRAAGGGLYVQRRKERGRRRELSVLLLVL